MSVATEPGRLDLHEGFAPDVPEWVDAARARRREILAAGCVRWPKHLRLVSTGGHFVPGRCGGTRVCDYCGILGGVEWSEMLALDAMENGAPTVYVCLTTSRPSRESRGFSIARQHLIRAIRREWAGAEYACLVEFTTGYGPKSGGRRRPHWNLMLKGVPDDPVALTRLRELVGLHWCGPAGARLVAQKVTPVWAAEGLIRYLALHFLKESQKPPRDWRGHRVTASAGYFGAGAGARRSARQRAREALRFKRQLWRAEGEGLRGAEALAVAEIRHLRAGQLRWECVELSVDSTTGEIVKARPISGADTVLAPAGAARSRWRSVGVGRERTWVNDAMPAYRSAGGTIEEWALVNEHFRAPPIPVSGERAQMSLD